MQPTSPVGRLHQLAAAIKDTTNEANAALQRPLAPWGETEEDRASVVLDTWVVAILDAMLAACDGDALTPTQLIRTIERLAETQHLAGADLALLALHSQQWLVGNGDAQQLAIPVVGYIAADDTGDNARVFFYNEGEA